MKFKVMLNENSDTQLYSFNVMGENQDIRILNGGDIGTTKWAKRML